MTKPRFYKRKWKGVTMLLFFALFESVLFLTPRQAQAQWVVANPDILAADIQRQLATQIEDNVENAFVASIASSLVNLMLYTVNQMAYTAAVWVATGGPGERPLFSREQVEDYMRYAAAEVAVDVYDSVSIDVLEDNDGYLAGFNVRLNDSPAYLASVRQGILSSYIRPKISFDFTDIANNYQGYLVSVYEDDSLSPQQQTETILATMANSFRTNEFSSGLQLYSDTLLKSSVESSVQSDEYLANNGFQPQTDAASGYVDLPASFVEDQLSEAILRTQDLPFQIGQGALSDSNTLLNVGVYAGSIFTNTLLSELMKKLYAGLFADISPTFSTNPFDPSASDSLTRSRAQSVFSSLQSFKPLEVSDYDLVSRLSSCASSRLLNSRQLYSCAINTSFASALSFAEAGNALTLAEAIDEGYIDGNWALIPSSDTSRNQDTSCRNYGFCHSNLVKLRKARIIPIGWELAAESDANSSSDPVTLSEVMGAFYNCNADGQRDDENPWCHLIDPNWVLKAPEAECRTLAYGQLLTASGTENRAEECVDIQTCVSEGDDGSCEGGYGYCTREKNTWRFRGDACPAHFASCLTFETSEGESVDYLRNTVDFTECDGDAAGCLWRQTMQVPTAEENYDWPVINDVAAADAANDAYLARIYLNDNAEECNASEGGCAELIERPDDLDLTLNLVQNASFELDADENGWPDKWLHTSWDDLTYDTSGDYARTGEAAPQFSGGLLYQYGLTLNQSRFYSFSLYARQEDGAAGDDARAYLFLQDALGEEEVDLSSLSITGDDCTFADLNSDGVDESVLFSLEPDGEEYQRYECVFTAPTLNNKGARIDAILNITDSSLFIDDIQLEQTADPSAFHVNYSDRYDTTVVKVAPDYLGCTGSATDPAECDNYAQVCSADDVGCKLYTPENGDPSVSGLISELNVCPAACVGYDTYKQEPTRYEPQGEFPVYFIAETADSCDEEAVGCDEFTNLSTEETEYYTYLRACVTSDQADANTGGDQGAVYYTWEGSDEEGYQLREWSLLESDLDGAAYSNYGYDTDGDGVDDHTEEDPGAAPCTHWETNEDGITCTDDADANSVIDTESSACDEHDDILDNPDCREFYDENGDIHYRDWTLTVTVNDACVSYRKTNLAGLGDDTDSDGTDDGEENCTEAGGYFDAATNECRFYGYSEESTECAARENGCRKYTGNRSANSRLVFEDLFEEGTVRQWEADSATTVTLSNESVATDGHSLRSDGEDVWTYLYDEGSACTTTGGCSSSGSTLGGECTVSEGDQFCGTLGGDIFAGKTYTLTFWAKGAGDLDVGFDVGFGGSPSIDAALEEDLEIDAEWRRYSIGPVDLNEEDFADVGDDTVLVFSPQSSSTFYIDNVVLREGEDNITVIKDSWVTPATCDVNLEGELSPQYHLGCEAYTDSDGNTANLKSFSSLCDEEDVGCSAYFRTFESDATHAQIVDGVCNNIELDTAGDPVAVSSNTSCYLLSDGAGAYDTNSPELCSITPGKTSCRFNLDFYLPNSIVGGSIATLSHVQYAADTAYVPADSDLFLIVDPNDECSVSSAGCMELGEPSFSADKSVVDAWTTVHYLNDPDAYDTILCSEGELFCEEFDAGAEGTFYFKDPQASMCEYRTDVSLGGVNYDGWFRKDTNEFCYGTGECSESGDSCTIDADCRVDTGVCSASGSICSSDTDCNATEYCAGLSEETCEIDTGSYVVGGDFSGIWRNGDDAYTGLVGLCEAQWDACSEFVDTLDYDDNEYYAQENGESYYFIDNRRLDEDDLLGSSRCKGQVSQSLGCVLFYETGDPGLDYNASASYVSSANADALHGDQPFDLVKPIDCNNGSSFSAITTPTGDVVDLCAQRCVYDAGEVASEDSASVKLAEEDVAEDDSLYSIDDLWLFGTSCYSDNDCAPKESRTGEVVNGSCLTTVDVDGYNGGALENGTAAVPRLENDTNRVMKVNRDRVCSEWLQCSSSFTVWNEDLGKFQEICDGIALCTEYSGSGDSSFCSEWDPDDPAVVLNQDRYVSRDISWYGEEYSGYSIPQLFPVQHFEQVNVSPPVGECYVPSNHFDRDRFQGNSCNTDSDCSTGAICSSDGDCNTGETCEASVCTAVGACTTEDAKDFRLAFNAGSCSEEHESACTVGYCADNGAACAGDADCETGVSCITGQCYDIGAAACGDSNDCSAGEECVGGFCAEDLDETCGIDFSCATSGATCVSSVATKEGTCLRGQCLLSLDGNQFDEETHEAAVCRGNPEVNSPFGNEVVTNWSLYNLADEAVVTTDAVPTSTDFDSNEGGSLPRSTLSGFQNVNLCAGGEECVCSYTKLATSTGQTGYIDSETNIESTEIKGICQGGDVDGAFCEEDADCGDAVDGFATCQPITKEDTLIGLEGYCLERDTGININGDPELGACLTWFPVDQLQGSSDLYAKYKGAGYFQDAYTCGFTEVFTDVYASTGACAESTGGACDDTASECQHNAVCDNGMYAVLGRCSNSGTSSSDASNACVESGSADEDCPYTCVPYNSFNEETGEVCDPDNAPEDLDYLGTSGLGLALGGIENDVYAIGDSDDYENYDAIADWAQGCVLAGITIEDYQANYSADFNINGHSNADGGGTTGDYGNRGIFTNAYQYPACRALVKVASFEESYAWTDRIYTSGEHTIGTMGYTNTTTQAPFGLTWTPEELAGDGDNDPRPARLLVCQDEQSDETGEDYRFCTSCSSSSIVLHYEDRFEVPLEGESCAESSAGAPSWVDEEDPEARSWIDITINSFTGGTEIGSTTSTYTNGTLADADEEWLDGGDGWTDSRYINFAESLDTGLSRMNSVFARFVDLYVYDRDNEKGQETDGFEEDREAFFYESFANSSDTISYSSLGYSDYVNSGTDVREVNGEPPRVWALDLDNCYGSYCREGQEGSLTLNSKNVGNHTSTGGFFRSVLKFYAAADKNQLPIRRVIVDWGDGSTFSGSDADDNFYKNHRGILPDSSTSTYCDTEEEWGMTPDSCDPNFFSYNHNYFCSTAIIERDLSACTFDGDGLATNTPCTTISGGIDVCVFRPRIHVRDNWGFCTGTCTLQGDDSCFEHDGDSLSSPTDTFSECSYEIYPERVSSVDPWVYYEGNIVVEP